MDMQGPLGKNLLPPIPAAAHVRTMRKGSSDHLALNIDSESDRLINHHETDDKGLFVYFPSSSSSSSVKQIFSSFWFLGTLTIWMLWLQL